MDCCRLCRTSKLGLRGRLRLSSLPVPDWAQYSVASTSYVARECAGVRGGGVRGCDAASLADYAGSGVGGLAVGRPHAGGALVADAQQRAQRALVELVEAERSDLRHTVASKGRRYWVSAGPGQEYSEYSRRRRGGGWGSHPSLPPAGLHSDNGARTLEMCEPRDRCTPEHSMQSSVPKLTETCMAQMWPGVRPSPGADVAGVSPVPAQMWHGVRPSPGADVAGVSPVPAQTWSGPNLRRPSRTRRMRCRLR